MKTVVQLRKVNRPREIVALDTERGTFTAQLGETQDIHGNYMSIGEQEFGVFASGNNLYLQWNNRRWNLHGLGPRVKCEHDFQGKTTSFSVDDASIQYPAWWDGDMTFDPCLPERDEDEDFLAYVANLAKNDELQKILIQSWNG